MHEELPKMLAEVESVKNTIPILFKKVKWKNYLNSLKAIKMALDYINGINIIRLSLQHKHPTAFWWPLKKGNP